MLLSLTACSAPSENGPAQNGPRASAPRAASGAVLMLDTREPAAPGDAAVLRSRVTRVAGRLSDVRRDRVARQARAVVEGFLGGAFGSEGDPLRSFTGDLRRAARSDELVVQPGVEVTHAAAWFAVAAPTGRPVGITARLAVDLADGDRTTSVTGRLLLTRVEREWRVFGYDLARSTEPVPDPRPARAREER